MPPVGDPAAAGNGGGDAPAGPGRASLCTTRTCSACSRDIGHLVEQVPADGDVIAVADADDAHRAPREGDDPAAMSSGVPGRGVDDMGGQSGVVGRRSFGEAGPRGPRVDREQRPRLVEADPFRGVGDADVKEDHGVPGQRRLGLGSIRGAPPRATTPVSSRRACATSARSRVRKAGPPASMKMSAMVRPLRLLDGSKSVSWHMVPSVGQRCADRRLARCRAG